MPANTYAVYLKNVTKRFAENIILEDVTLAVPANSITCVIGPSGIGKTCFLRIVAGLDEDFKGRVLFHGKDVTDLKPSQRNIAFLFQHAVLYPYLTAMENICFPLKVQRIPKHTAEQHAKYLADLLQIKHLLPRKPNTLSGGERQRVALARTFAAEAQLRLLDEPLKASFEPSLKLELRAQIRQLHKKLGGTIILITHDQEEGLELADNLIIMLPGQKPTILESRSAYTAPPSTKIAMFIGGGTLIEAKYNKQALCLVGLDGQTYNLSGPISKPSSIASKWVVRPEAITLVDGNDFKINDIGYHGAFSRVKLRCLRSANKNHSENKTASFLTAHIDSRSNFYLGQNTGIWIDPGGILGFDGKGLLCQS